MASDSAEASPSLGLPVTAAAAATPSHAHSPVRQVLVAYRRHLLAAFVLLAVLVGALDARGGGAGGEKGGMGGAEGTEAMEEDAEARNMGAALLAGAEGVVAGADDGRQEAMRKQHRKERLSATPAAPKLRAPSPVERAHDENGTSIEGADVDNEFEAREARDIDTERAMHEWCRRRGRDACRFPPPPGPATPEMLSSHAELVDQVLNHTGIHKDAHRHHHRRRRDDGTDGKGALLGSSLQPIYSHQTAEHGGTIRGARTGIQRIRVIGDRCSGVAQATELLRFMLDKSLDVRGGLFRPAGAFQDPDARPADVSLEPGEKWDEALGDFEPLPVRELKDTLVIVVVQNVYDWLWCEYARGSGHAVHSSMAFDQFYTTKWAPVMTSVEALETLMGNETCRNGYAPFEMVPCRVGNGAQAYEMDARVKGRPIQPFENLLALRRAKLENYIVDLRKTMRNHVVLRAEDMLRYSKMQDFLVSLSRRFAISLPHGSLLPSTTKGGDDGNDNFPAEITGNITSLLKTAMSRFYLFPNTELESVLNFLREYQRDMEMQFKIAAKQRQMDTSFCMVKNAWKSPQCLEMGVGKKARNSFPFHIRANMMEINRMIDQAMEAEAGYRACEVRDTNTTGKYYRANSHTSEFAGYDAYLVEELCCEDCLANTVDIERDPAGYSRSMAFIRRHAPQVVRLHDERTGNVERDVKGRGGV